MPHPPKPPLRRARCRAALGTLLAAALGACAPLPPPAPVAPRTAAAPGHDTAAEHALRARIDAWRSQCGFPPYLHDARLRRAALNHSRYMARNGRAVTDFENPAAPGFTGIDGLARARAAGWSNLRWASSGSADQYMHLPADGAALGRGVATIWAGGVYHQLIVAGQYRSAGAGLLRVTDPRFPAYALELATIALGGWNRTFAGARAPLTFPCAGIRDVPYGEAASSELPLAPGVSRRGFGTPVTLVGNPGERVLVLRATMESLRDGRRVALRVLDEANDPNHEIRMPAQAVVYPTSPLRPRTTYRVDIEGTEAGRAFRRTFSFTTSATMG